MEKSQSIVEIVRQNPSKRGLALVVTNDYSKTPGFPSPLKGPLQDGARMKDVFNKLQIACLWKHNVSCGELNALLTELAALRGLPGTYESISFVFAGHGRREEVNGQEDVYMQDGRTKPIQEIINTLLPEQAPNIGNIPKLFFIDACRGSSTAPVIMVPRSANAPQKRHLQRRISERGGENLGTIVIPNGGNILVAYSVSTGHRAMEGTDGGIWMKALAAKLIESKKSVEAVLTEVRENLIATYQGPEWATYMQLPETVNKLLRLVHLNPQTSPRVKCSSVPPVAPPAAPPGGLTQRDVKHPGHYRGRLLQFEQTGIIKNVEEEYEGNFICVLKFVMCSNGKIYHVRSKQELKSQAEAKEAAAKLAVTSLDVIQSKQDVTRKKSDTPNNTPTKASCGGSVAVASPKPGKADTPTKDPISRLKEYCDRENIPQPAYTEVECDEQYRLQVTVKRKSFVGSPKPTKKEAKKSAAQKALNGLRIQ